MQSSLSITTHSFWVKIDEAVDLIKDESKTHDMESVNAVFSLNHVRSFGRPQYVPW
jgi:hypothetical protein